MYDTFDLDQDIARSAFGDMILDVDRNERYKTALSTVIEKTKKKNLPAHVIDIGTGSGILSLLAANLGCDSVFAIESFEPVGLIAKKIFEKSKYKNKIRLSICRSIDLREDHPKSNIIVAEVFDTELIGEGALRTFKQAHKDLVKSKARVIPSKARIWIVPVQSSELQNFNKHPDICKNAKFVQNCNGFSSAFDLQMTSLNFFIDFIALSDAFVAFEFDFEDPHSLKYYEHCFHQFTVKNFGNLEKKKKTFDCVFFWWDLDMDNTQTNFITTAPRWINPNHVWRDHWMQAIFYLPEPILVETDEVVRLHCFHDEFTFWFTTKPTEFAFFSDMLRFPWTDCALHKISSRSSLYRLNLIDRNPYNILNLIKEFCNDNYVISINEGSFFGIYAAETAKQVKIIDEDPFFDNILQDMIEEKEYKHVKIMSSLAELFDNHETKRCKKLHVISEVYYISSFSPFDTLNRYKNKITSIIQNFSLTHELDFFVKRIEFKAMPVAFTDLWKIVANFDTVFGCDLSLFNEFYQNARTKVDNCIETHPLWEYDSVCTGLPITIIDLRFDKYTLEELEEPLRPKSEITPSIEGTNAVVFWLEIDFAKKNDTQRISYGLLEPCEINSAPFWHRGHRQGVYFIPGLAYSRKGLDLYQSNGEKYVITLPF